MFISSLCINTCNNFNYLKEYILFFARNCLCFVNLIKYKKIDVMEKTLTNTWPFV